jgi:hypothetical protein
MNSGPTLRLGSTGAEVRRLQILLVMMKLLDFSSIDSNFGLKHRMLLSHFNKATISPPMGSLAR